MKKLFLLDAYALIFRSMPTVGFSDTKFELKKYYLNERSVRSHEVKVEIFSAHLNSLLYPCPPLMMFKAASISRTLESVSVF